MKRVLPMLSFEGRVALITGGASGIGRATAIRFAQAGARVILADLQESAGTEVAQLICEGGGEAVFIRTDVTCEAEVDKLVETAVCTFGGLHYAFNNAGVEGQKGVSTTDLSLSDWNRIIAINLTSVWLCMRAELRHMLEHGGGAIVNTSSTAGLFASVNSGVAYAASKHGVLGLTKTAAKEFAGRGVRINAICPAGVKTPLLERTIGSQGIDKAGSSNPMGRVATAEEIAESVLWLCSDTAPFVVGHSLLIDGGRFA